MNSLIAEFRRLNPKDTTTDADLFQLFGEEQDKNGTFSGYPDFVADWNLHKQQVRDANYEGLYPEFKKGLERGTRGLASTALAGGALGLGAVGWQGGRDYLLGKAQEQEALASSSELEPNIPSVTKIGGVRDAVRWAAGGLGEVAPSIVEALGTSVAGAAAGTLVEPVGGTAVGALGGLVERQAIKALIRKWKNNELKAAAAKLVKDQLAKYEMTGLTQLTRDGLSDAAKDMLAVQAKTLSKTYTAGLANVVNSYVLNAGEIYQNVADEVGPDRALNVALLGGVAAAVPDSFLPSYVTSRVLGNLPGGFGNEIKNPFYRYVTKLAQEMAVTVPGEGITESFQEWVGYAAENYAKGKSVEDSAKDLLSNAALRERMLNAGALGALGGALAAPAATLGGDGEKALPNKPDEPQQGDDKRSAEEETGKDRSVNKEAISVGVPNGGNKKRTEESINEAGGISNQLQKNQNSRQPENNSNSSSVGSADQKGHSEIDTKNVQQPDKSQQRQAEKLTTEQTDSGLSAAVDLLAQGTTLLQDLINRKTNEYKNSQQKSHPESYPLETGDESYNRKSVSGSKKIQSSNDFTQAKTEDGEDKANSKKMDLANSEIKSALVLAGLKNKTKPNENQNVENQTVTELGRNENEPNVQTKPEVSGPVVEAPARKPEGLPSVPAEPAVEEKNAVAGNETRVEPIAKPAEPDPTPTPTPKPAPTPEPIPEPPKPEPPTAPPPIVAKPEKLPEAPVIELHKNAAERDAALQRAGTEKDTHKTLDHLLPKFKEASGPKEVFPRVELTASHGPSGQKVNVHDAIKSAVKAVQETKQPQMVYLLDKATGKEWAQTYYPDGRVTAQETPQSAAYQSYYYQPKLDGTTAERLEHLRQNVDASMARNRKGSSLRIQSDAMPPIWRVEDIPDGLNRTVESLAGVGAGTQNKKTSRVVTFKKPNGKLITLGTYNMAKRGEQRKIYVGNPDPNIKSPVTITEMKGKGYSIVGGASLNREANYSDIRLESTPAEYEQYFHGPLKQDMEEAERSAGKGLEENEAGDETVTVDTSEDSSKKPIAEVEGIGKTVATRDVLFTEPPKTEDIEMVLNEFSTNGKLLKGYTEDDVQDSMHAAFGLEGSEEVRDAYKRLIEASHSKLSETDTYAKASEREKQKARIKAVSRAIVNAINTSSTAGDAVSRIQEQLGTKTGNEPGKPSIVPGKESGGRGAGEAGGNSEVHLSEQEKANLQGELDEELGDEKLSVHEGIREIGTPENEARLNDTLSAIRAAGFTVGRISLKDGRKLLGEGVAGAADVSRRTMVVVTGEMAGRTDLVASLHELAHLVMGELSPEMQTRLLKAMDRVHLGEATKDPRIAKETISDPTLMAEEKLAELTGLNLEREGFNPAQAQSLGKRIARLFKEHVLRGAMWLLEKMGVDNSWFASRIAQKYFQNKVERVLAGDSRPLTIFKFTGGRPLTVEEQQRGFTLAQESVFSSEYNPDTERMEYAAVLPENVAAAEFNWKYTAVRTGDRVPVGEKPADQIAPEVAALNRTHDALQALKLVFDDLFRGRLTGISLEDFAIKFLLPGRMDLPKEIIAKKIELLKAANIDPGNIDARTVVDLNDLSKPEAHNIFLGLMNRIMTGINDRFNDLRLNGNKAVAAHDRISMRLNKYQERLMDITTTMNDLLDSFKGWNIELKEAISRGNLENKNAGVLVEQVRQLNKGLNLTMENVAEHYSKQLENFMAQLSNDPAARDEFVYFLEDLANDPTDFSPMTLADFNAYVQTKLKPEHTLVYRKNPIIHPAILGFVQENNPTMARLAARRVEGALVRDIIAEAKQSVDAAMRRIEKLGTKALPKQKAALEILVRDINRMAKERDQLNDQMANNERFMEFHQQAVPEIEKLMRESEQVLGATWQRPFEAKNDEEYFVAPSPTASRFDLERNVKKWKQKSFTPAEKAEIAKQMLANKAWLESHPEGNELYGGAMYNYLNRANETMMRALYQNDHQDQRYNVVTRFFGAMTNALRNTGMPGALRVARMVERFETLRHFERQKVERMANDWTKTLAAAMKATGYKPHQMELFMDRFYDAAYTFFERHKDVLWSAPKGKEGQAMAEVLVRWKDALKENPVTAKAMKEGAWEALERFYVASESASQYLVGKGKSWGLTLEEANGLFRNTKGAPRFEMMRTLSQEVRATHKEMLKAGWKEYLENWKREAMSQAYTDNRDALKSGTANLFNVRVWNEFMAPLANRVGSSPFMAPREILEGATVRSYDLEDGSSNVEVTDKGVKKYRIRAGREETMQALRDSKPGDWIGFAERIYDLTAEKKPGVYESKGDFVAETFDTLRAYFAALDSQAGSLADSQIFAIENIGHLLMDARVAENFPQEWLKFRRYTHNDLTSATTHMAYHAAFGRDMRGVFDAFKQGKNEAQERVSEWNRIKQEVDAKNLGKSPKELEPLYVKRAEQVTGKKDGWTRLTEAKKHSATMDAMQKHLMTFVQENNGMPMDVRVASELLSTMVFFALQGPKTGLTDLSSFFKQITNMGISALSLRTTMAAFKEFAKQNAGSLASVFWGGLNQSSEATRRLIEYGGKDSQHEMTFRDMYNAISMELAANPNYGWLGRKAVKAARVARALAGHGLPSKNDQFIRFRALAPFQQAQMTMQMAISKSVVDLYKDMVLRVVEYYKLNPNQVGQPVTAEQLGLGSKFFGVIRDDMTFEYMRNTLANRGLNLERLALDAMARKAKDANAPVLTEEAFTSIAMIGPSEVLQDTSLTSRAPWMMNNPLLKSASAMLGWSVQQSESLSRIFRGPQGQTGTWQERLRLKDPHFNRGVLSLLSMLPVGMAFAAMRDWYDEEVTGKKSNVMQPTSFRGMFDRLANVGHFGIMGDAANAFLNQDVGREFSADSRVFMLSSLKGVLNAVGTAYKQDSVTYATVTRPLFSSLGGSGYLQYADILNNFMGLDNMESRVVARINAVNYLRAAGRTVNLNVRTGKGMASSASEAKPWITEMVLAAYANDPVAFNLAKQRALAGAKEDGMDDPVESVKRAFGRQHPLRSPFANEPTASDYRRMLEAMGEHGARDVEEAVRMFNLYSGRLDLRPFTGSERARK